MTITETSTLKSLTMSHYLFDEGFNFETDVAKDPRLNLVAQDLFEALVATTHPGRSDLALREWHIPSDATPFAKVQAAFKSVRDGDSTPTTAERGDLVEYYRFLRNEKLKESRLSFWNALAGGIAPPKLLTMSDPIALWNYERQLEAFERLTASGRAGGIDKSHLRKFTGNEVEELFRSWLAENPASLERESLDLANRGLEYLPSEIGLFTKLKTLNLEGNSLIELPPEIGNLTKLTSMSVADNRLKTLPPEIGNLIHLDALSLKNNRLEFLPPQLGKLANLDDLILDWNRSLTELPEEMQSLTSLRALSIEGMIALPRVVEKMKSLQLLSISPALFQTLPKVVQILHEDLLVDTFKENGLSRAQLDLLREIGYFDEPDAKLTLPEAFLEVGKSVVLANMLMYLSVSFLASMLVLAREGV